MARPAWRQRRDRVGAAQCVRPLAAAPEPCRHTAPTLSSLKWRVMCPAPPRPGSRACVWCCLVPPSTVCIVRVPTAQLALPARLHADAEVHCRGAHHRARPHGQAVSRAAISCVARSRCARRRRGHAGQLFVWRGTFSNRAVCAHSLWFSPVICIAWLCPSCALSSCARGSCVSGGVRSPIALPTLACMFVPLHCDCFLPL